MDPREWTARVEPGGLWRDVIPESQTYGLTRLVGYASSLGVVGYAWDRSRNWLGHKLVSPPKEYLQVAGSGPG